jgi:hypothetical protein
MKFINTKFFFYSLFTTLFLCSSACNLAKAGSGGDSSQTVNTSQEAVANNTIELPTTNEVEKKAAEFTSQSVAGIYHYKTYKPNKGGNDNTLEITDKGKGKLQVLLSGTNMYLTGDGEETFHEGGGEGVAQLSGNTAVAQITPDGDDRKCRVTLTFSAVNQVKVAPAKNCSFNVALEGLYTKEKSTPIRSKQSANLAKISYGQLKDFVEDHNKNKTGLQFVITDVPAEKVSKTAPADKITNNRNLKGLYFFQIDDDDTDVSTTFIGSTALYKDYLAKVEHEPAKLRVTGVLVEFLGEFDFYRSVFVTKIEGLGDDGKSFWILNGTAPTKVKFQQ